MIYPCSIGVSSVAEFIIVHKQRFHMPLIQIFRDVLRYRNLVSFKRIKIAWPHFRRDLVADMEKLAQVFISRQLVQPGLKK